MFVTIMYFRDIPLPLVSAGVENGNLRELALQRMKDLGLKCRDVRNREVGIQEIHKGNVPVEVCHREDYYTTLKSVAHFKSLKYVPSAPYRQFFIALV